jgi:hypothetical protein
MAACIRRRKAGLRTALIVALVLAAACSREAPPEARPAKLPATCDRTQFQSATDQFDALVARRNEVLARVEAMPADEPAHYLRELERAQAEVRDLAARAQDVAVPRCLGHAKELVVRYLEQSRETMDMRRPGSDFSAYRLARETADGIHAQYAAEARLQAANRQ